MMKSFNVIKEDYGEFKPYDVMPYFINEYKETKKSDIPKTFDEFKEFVKSKSMYMFWARCQYEIILVDWPCQTKSKKIDVHEQIMMNLDIVTEILMENVKVKKETD